MWKMWQNHVERVRLSDVSHLIQDGDLLLCRNSRRIGDVLVSAASRSQYVHAGMAYRDGELRIVDVLQFSGGRNRLLADEVADYPGRYDVFKVDRRFREFDRDKAVAFMLQYCGTDYGWWNVIRASMRHLAFIRLLIPPLTDDQANGTYPPFCSQAVANACRHAGVDPVPNLADRATEPGDLARSLLFRYMFTLGGV